MIAMGGICEDRLIAKEPSTFAQPRSKCYSAPETIHETGNIY